MLRRANGAAAYCLTEQNPGITARIHIRFL